MEYVGRDIFKVLVHSGRLENWVKVLNLNWTKEWVVGGRVSFFCSCIHCIYGISSFLLLEGRN